MRSLNHIHLPGRLTLSLVGAAVLVLSVTATAGTINTSSLDWGVQYMIDESQTVFGNSQVVNPRDNRGLALSYDGRYLYAGYNNSFNNTGEVRMIDTTIADYTSATVAVLPGLRGKAIATDDQGRVYMAEGSSIHIYDSTLSTSLYTISNLTKSEGISVVRESGSLALYASDRTDGTLSRWTISEGVGDAVTGAVQEGLDGDGLLNITGASDLRGIEVDVLGRIWLADKGTDAVFRINNDGTGFTSMALDNPMDIAFDGDQVFISQYTDRMMSALAMDTMSLLDSFTAPWSALALDADGQSGYGAFSGLAMGMGKLFVANEAGQTAGERSTYGAIDANSGWDGSDYYTDLYADDNDPILVITPEPASLLLLVLGSRAFLKRRRV